MVIVADIAEHCNLNCQNCDHFSPISKEYYMSYKEFERDIARISEIMQGKISMLKIEGGEPLLNSDIELFLSCARYYVKNAAINIVTNGLLHLYIDFAPIWMSADGHHMYRNIQFPYFHLIFADELIKEYCESHHINYAIERLNKWSMMDFLMLFLSQKDMKVIDFVPYFNTRDYYFIKTYPQLLSGYSMEDLLTSGMKIVFKR